jgi:hypothetical protein
MKERQLLRKELEAMEPTILVAAFAILLAAIGALAALFGADSREPADDDWQQNGHSRASI